MHIVGICGSLRGQSFNRMLLRLASECLQARVTLAEHDWSAIPPFNADLLAQGMPPAAQALRDRIRDADGVVIATPEYNFSVPGMLKNALDWVSRGDDQPLRHRPVAILSASTGPLGGARVQYDLRKVLLFTHSAVLTKPEVFVGQAPQKFDAQGACTDQATRTFVQAQMDAFLEHIHWQRQVRRAAHATA